MALHEEITRNYYATTADRGHRPTAAHYDFVAAGLTRRMRPWLPADRRARCIDLACGCGEMLYALERAGFTDTRGVDLCAEELEQARGFVKGQLIEAEVVDYLAGLPDGDADLITAFNLIEHLPESKLLDFFAQARRVLRKGGALVAQVPNAVSPFGASTRYWDITHHRAFSPNSVTQVATMAGWSKTSIDFRECGPVPYGVKSAVRWAAWQALRGAIAAWFLVEVGGTRGGVYTMDMLFRLRKEG
jgi:SAM-dependent methyltransferase